MSRSPSAAKNVPASGDQLPKTSWLWGISDQKRPGFGGSAAKTSRLRGICRSQNLSIFCWGSVKTRVAPSDQSHFDRSLVCFVDREMRCVAKNVPASGDQLPKRPGFGGSRARCVLRLVSVGGVRVDPPRLPKMSRLFVSKHSAAPPHDSVRCQNISMVIPRVTKNVPALGDQRRCS